MKEDTRDFSYDFEALPLEDKVKLARDNEAFFELLLNDFQTHIRQLASRVTGKYVDEHSDEWSVSILAFLEAVKKYDADKGSFVAFADLVIRRRLVDDIRGHEKEKNEIVVDVESAESSEELEGGAAYKKPGLEVMKYEQDVAQQRSAQEELKLEIEVLSEELSKYGIAFSDLVSSSPKAKKTKRACARAVMAVVENPEILYAMKSIKILPGKKIREITEVPQKILDRHRKYIIATVVIMAGDYPGLGEYVRGIKEEGSK